MAIVSSEPADVTLALVGSGKSTLGRALAARLALRWDAELAEEARLAEAADWDGQDDEAILSAEAARDSKARAERLGGRVVEAWHPGNHARACARAPDRRLKDLDGWHERAAQAVRDEMATRRVLVLAVLGCSHGARKQPREAAGAQRLPKSNGNGGDVNEEEEEEVLRIAARIGGQAAESARAMCGAAAVKEVWTEGDLDAAVRSAVVALLEMVLPPPEVKEAPLFFKSIASALQVLRAGAAILPELREQLSKPQVADRLAKAEAAAAAAAGPAALLFPIPVVTIDGLDGTGKSTLVSSLAQRLGAEVMRTSPPSLDALRSLLEGGSVSASLKSLAASRLKRAFFMVSNYVAALEVAEAAAAGRAKCVVIDRFYASTAAYTLGCSPSEPMASLPRDVWAWPTDLPMPKAMLVLAASEEVRSARIQARAGQDGTGIAEWELRSAADPAFGRGIMSAFEALRAQDGLGKVCPQPPIDVVDADGSRAEVLRASIGCCVKRCIVEHEE